MNTENLFPQKTAARPTIYAYSDSHPQFRGVLKVGYTDREHFRQMI